MEIILVDKLEEMVITNLPLKSINEFLRRPIDGYIKLQSTPNARFILLIKTKDNELIHFFERIINLAEENEYVLTAEELESFISLYINSINDKENVFKRIERHFRRYIVYV